VGKICSILAERVRFSEATTTLNQIGRLQMPESICAPLLWTQEMPSVHPPISLLIRGIQIEIAAPTSVESGSKIAGSRVADSVGSRHVSPYRAAAVSACTLSGNPFGKGTSDAA
jgi:hypothetical protein